MTRLTVDRRRFCAALAAALVGACSKAPPPSADPKVDLARSLALQPEQRTLRDALLSGQDAPSRRTVDLLMKVIGRRERLFAYVGYPSRANGLTACDGLIRE